jgi:hypothetical protein
VRWAARGSHPAALIAADVSQLAAAAFVLAFLVVARRARLRSQFTRALPAFAPAGISLAIAYDYLFAAFDRSRVDRRAAQRDSLVVGDRVVGAVLRTGERAAQ